MVEQFKREYKTFKKEVQCAASQSFTYGIFLYYIFTGLWKSELYDSLVDIFNKYFKENYIEVTEGPGKDLLLASDIAIRANLVGIQQLEQLAIANFDIE